MSRSLFQTKLAHRSPTLRSVPPPRQYPYPESGQPRISAVVSHMYRLGGCGNIAQSFNVRRVLVQVLNWFRIKNPFGCRHGCAAPVIRTRHPTENKSAQHNQASTVMASGPRAACHTKTLKRAEDYEAVCHHAWWSRTGPSAGLWWRWHLPSSALRRWRTWRFGGGGLRRTGNG